MRRQEDIMGMPVVIEVVGANDSVIEQAFDYLRRVDATFSTYKRESEISKINRGEIIEDQYSEEMREILQLSEETKQRTDGYFDIRTPHGSMDPSGLVKGWAIRNAWNILRTSGYADVYLEIGGDIQTSGLNAEGKEWHIGIRNPFNRAEIVKVIEPRGHGVVTSGTAVRGAHIWNPYTQKPVETDVASITVIGPDVFEADRFATAAFAMGRDGIAFIESLDGFEAYQIMNDATALKTSRFSQYSYESH